MSTRVLAVLIAGLATACGGSLPTPNAVNPPGTAFVPVPYPPPAALSEVVPKRPENAVWVDGSWAWRGRSYVWQRGGWVRPAAGAAYSPWRLIYTRDGRLLFAESSWYDAKGNKLEEPKVVTPATTPPNEITPENQVAR